MQRKSSREQCDRLRNFDPVNLKEQCALFVEEHSQAISSAKPGIPPELNDRAADIWEPLFVLADIAGGHWPDIARKAAIYLSSNAHESSPITSLLLDMFLALSGKEGKPVPTNAIIPFLLSCGDRPWNEGKKQKDLTHAWLAKQLRPYGAHSKNIRIGDTVVKGYAFADLLDAFRRYLPKSVIQTYVDEQRALHDESNAEKPDDPSRG
jgi:putative DNA primase/helicase